MQWNTHNCQMSAFLKHSNLDKHMTDSMLNVFFFCKTPDLSPELLLVYVMSNAELAQSTFRVLTVSICSQTAYLYSELITNTENGEIIFRP